MGKIKIVALPVCHNRETDEEQHNDVKLPPPDKPNNRSEPQVEWWRSNDHVTKASWPAAKVSALNKEASPLGLDDRLQAEDDQAEQVDQEGDLHQGGIALERLWWELVRNTIKESLKLNVVGVILILYFISPVVCWQTQRRGRGGRWTERVDELPTFDD